MKHPFFRSAFVSMLAVSALLGFAAQARAQTDALPSWNNGPAKQAVVAFVKDTTDKASLKFVPSEARIATFDQDGTLWVEYAYGPAQGLPDTRVGAFPQTLYDQAKKQGWTVVSMKKDWKRVFSFEQ